MGICGIGSSLTKACSTVGPPGRRDPSSEPTLLRGGGKNRPPRCSRRRYSWRRESTGRTRALCSPQAAPLCRERPGGVETPDTFLMRPGLPWDIVESSQGLPVEVDPCRGQLRPVQVIRSPNGDGQWPSGGCCVVKALRLGEPRTTGHTVPSQPTCILHASSSSIPQRLGTY